MKTILCYGDSNTWGYNPTDAGRYPRDVRWTGVMARELGPDYQVIEEGLNGRTTVWDDPIEGYKNGRDYLIPCLETHRPIDLVVLMLGSNDLKIRFSVSAYDIANGAGVLVDIIQKSAAGLDGGAPRVLLLAPPPIARLSDFAEMFEGGPAKSQKLAQNYRRVADERNCDFLDTSTVVVSSDVDGIHLDPGEHSKMGKAVAKRVKDMLG